MKGAPVLLAALVLVGSLQLTHGDSTPALQPRASEVAFGPLAAGSTAGANATNASAAIAGAVGLETTQNLLYLNNTNASGAYHVRIVTTQATGLTGATTLNVGIHNGTATDQVTVTNGILTQSAGPYVRLAPGSTNRIYAETLVGILYGTGFVALDVYVADDPSESAYYVMRANLTVT